MAEPADGVTVPRGPPPLLVEADGAGVEGTGVVGAGVSSAVDVSAAGAVELATSGAGAGTTSCRGGARRCARFLAVNGGAGVVALPGAESPIGSGLAAITSTWISTTAGAGRASEGGASKAAAPTTAPCRTTAMRMLVVSRMRSHQKCAVRLPRTSKGSTGWMWKSWTPSAGSSGRLRLASRVSGRREG